MPSFPLRIQDIGSINPSFDPRNSSANVVIDGRNFVFDSKGPKSGFSARTLTPYPLVNCRQVQGIEVQGEHMVFTDDAVMRWRETPPYTWDYLITFDLPLALNQRGPWNAIFIDDLMVIAHPGRGLYTAPYTALDTKLQFVPKDSDSILGIIDGIEGMGLVHGRAILVNDSTIQWGSTLDFSDFTPGFGGPGFQLINAYVTGDFVALTTFEDGFVVWTTKGSVIAEYIGGDATWRFFPGTAAERPISAQSTVTLSNGQTIMLTASGVMNVDGARVPEALTPDFNEWLRDYIKNYSPELQFWRIDYDRSRQWIMLSESTDGILYYRTYVLSPTLNKWGVFSDSVYGFLQLADTKYGYVDRAGIPQYFMEAWNRQANPAPLLGQDLIMPRVQKELTILSSTFVCRSLGWDVTPTMAGDEVLSAGWYLPNTDRTALPALKGMDSWIEVGYASPPELAESADNYIEIQEIIIGSIPSLAPEVMDFTSEWKAEEFYVPFEDWQSIIGGDEDWNVLDGNEDWWGYIGGLSRVTHQLQIHSSQDGITFDSFTPVMARFNTAARVYATQTSGTLHRLLIGAFEVGEYYRVEYLQLTLEYGGQQI